MVNKGRSKRVGILAENEIALINRADNRENLIKERNLLREKDSRNKEESKRLQAINKELGEISTRLSKLVKDLHKRIIANENDWRIILKSRSLKSLLIISYKHFVHFPSPHEGDYDNYGIRESISEIIEPKYVEFDGTEKVPDYSTWKIKFEFNKQNKERVYWLDDTIEPVLTSEDTFSPDFAMKGIKGTWNRKVGNVIEKFDVRVILKEALDLEKRFQGRIKNKKLPRILPRDKDSALDIFTIKSKIEQFHDKKQSDDSLVPIVHRSQISQEQYVRERNKDLDNIYAEAKPYFEKISEIYAKYNFEL